MADQTIVYKGGYKYQLIEDYEVEIRVTPESDVTTQYLDLDTNGKLTIRTGYAWDGPSGPTKDTESFMRGALVHDALYQLMRHQHIERHWRKQADKEMRRICREDGMFGPRRWWTYTAVRLFAKKAASADNAKKVIRAP